MPQSSTAAEATKTIVLVGIGHTHAHVVRNWVRHPVSGARLICVSNFPVATYSGMLPGVLSGQYRPEQMQIDLTRLCTAAGATLILDSFSGVDLAKRELQFPARPPIKFDVLSLGIGSVPDMSALRGDVPGSIVPIKPMQTFLDRLETARNRQGTIHNVSIVGGGAAGIEIAFCLPGYFRTRGLAVPAIHIIQRDAQLMPGASQSARRHVERLLMHRNVTVSRSTSVISANDRTLHLDTGKSVSADLVVWATGAIAPPILSQCHLPQDDRGFLQIDPTLRVITGDPVFAVGDTGSFVGESVPKAGVYAVRQGPILWENIQRQISVQPLIPFQPQKSFLRLLNTGEGSAIADAYGLSFTGPPAWWLKDWIDRGFMAKFRV